MNEFEWRRQLRELRQPQHPQRDLWPSIDAALSRSEQNREPSSGQAPTRPRHARRTHWLIGTAVAASLLLTVSGGWHTVHAPDTAPTTAAVSPKPTNWKPSDPRLAGAAIELNAAQMELKLALEQSPDSPALQRLLDRTEMQQTQLRQLANQAG